jgi:predicted Zn-dependent peptidase
MLRVARQIGVQALRQTRFSSGGAGEDINPLQVGAPDHVVRVGGRSIEVGTHTDEGVHTSQLDLGTKVVTQDLGGSVAQITFLYRDGPVYENIFNAGISSFMRHALTKDGMTSSEYITKTFLQKAGVVVHPPTAVAKSYLAFTVEGFRDTLTQAAVVDKFWQSLLFPRFSGDNLKEVKRLLELETKEAKRDTPFEYLQDVLHKTAFKGSPLGHTQYVPSYNLGYVDSAKLFDRWDAHYGFANIAVVGTNVDHHGLLEALTDSPWVARAHPKVGGVVAPASKYSGGEGYDVLHRAKEFDDQFSDVYSTFTAYGFKTPGRAHLKEYAATLVVVQALTNAVNPVLNNSFAPKRASVFFHAYDTVGVVGLATVQASAAQLRAFRATLERLGGLSDAALAPHKNAALLAAAGTADSWRGTQAALVESFATTGVPVSPQEVTAAIKAVTAADVKAAVGVMLGAPPTLVHHGDSPCAPTLAEL